jgi:hypothetical protein
MAARQLHDKRMAAATPGAALLRRHREPNGRLASTACLLSMPHCLPTALGGTTWVDGVRARASEGLAGQFRARLS